MLIGWTPIWVPSLSSFFSDARRALRLQQVSALRDLRFTSTFHNNLTDVGLNQICSGEFTLAGPIASSMRPLPDNTLRQTVTIQDGGDDVVFGLSTSGQLMTVTERQGITSQTRVPLPPHLFKMQRRIQAMSYDAKRHRLLLATAAGTRSEIVAFDIEESEWTKVHELGRGVIGMTYVPEEDAIWTVISQYSIRDKTELADFVVLDAQTGEEQLKKRVSHPLRQPSTNSNVRTSYSVLQNSQAQLIASDGRAVLVGTRGRRVSGQPTSDQEDIFVIDSKDGTLLYSGPAVINDGRDPLEWIAKRDTSANEAIGPLGELAKKFAMAKDAIEQLRDSDEEVADELAVQLVEAKAELEGTTKESKKPKALPGGTLWADSESNRSRACHGHLRADRLSFVWTASDGVARDDRGGRHLAAHYCRWKRATKSCGGAGRRADRSPFGPRRVCAF